MKNEASSLPGDLAARSEARLCGPDNWTTVLDDPAPRAVRWATREIRSPLDVGWGKWHYTEGNGAFTACGSAVINFAVDGSPQESDVSSVTCQHCLRKMQHMSNRSVG